MALSVKPTIKNVWASTGLKVEPSDAKMDTGWIVERPPHQFQNYLQHRVDSFIKHVNEAGIPVWDAATVYTAGKSYVQGSDGKIYKCVTDGFNENPVGNPTNWSLTFGDAAVQEYANIAEAAAIEAEASAEEAANAAAAALISEDAAAASATDALTSENNAETAAAAALASQNSAFTSASNASTSATNAGNSATLAQSWAIKMDGPVSGGEYSAKYWASTIAGGPVASWVGLQGVITLVQARTALSITNVNDTSDANKPISTATQGALDLKAPLANPVLTGIPTAPTAAAGTSSTQLATTAFVTTADNLKAPLASPNLTGVPTAPTAPVGTATTQIATTEFVASVATPTGMFATFMLTSAPTGWVAGDGSTIGNVGSGATRANVDTLALFTAWWNAYTNTQLPILTSAGGASTRGASAAADWAALKRLTVFDVRGRFARSAGTINSLTFVNGTKYADMFRSHNHGIGGNEVFGTAGTFSYYQGQNRDTGLSETVGGGETAPVSLVMLGCFKL